MATNYDVDYDDQRFDEVEKDKQKALDENDKIYDDMINQSDKYWEDQIKASKDWADKQSKIQQDQTDFAIEKIEQQKDQTKKDYIKEQSGAYVDWQKQSNQYGAEAEKMASAGLTNTGFSESSQVSMYNTYQNRVATARESYNNAVLNYNNAIKDATLQNNSALAEIAYQALQQQLELSLQGFQYKNQLLLDKAAKRTDIENTFYSRWKDVLNQINTENSFKFQQEQFEWQKKQAAKRSSGGGGSGGSGSINKGSSKKTNAQVYKEAQSEKIAQKKKQQSDASAYAYLNELIASGASKTKVSNEIALALKDGAITKAEATRLRNIFTPRGYTY